MKNWECFEAGDWSSKDRRWNAVRIDLLWALYDDREQLWVRPRNLFRTLRDAIAHAEMLSAEEQP